MIHRREFIGLLSGAAVTLPLATQAQQVERVRRIGVLTGGGGEDDLDAQARMAAFVQELQQLGWTDGDNVRIETRWATYFEDLNDASEFKVLRSPLAEELGVRFISTVEAFANRGGWQAETVRSKGGVRPACGPTYKFVGAHVAWAARTKTMKQHRRCRSCKRCRRVLC